MAPPGLQEVVKIQNKYSTKSTLSRLNSGEALGVWGGGGVGGILEMCCFSLVLLKNCFEKNINH